MKEFMYILNADVEWKHFTDKYIQVRTFGIDNGNKDYPLGEHEYLDDTLCDLCIEAVDALHMFSDKVGKARFNVGICAKRLKKMPASRKIPKVYSHETVGTWKINSEKLMLADYSKRMTDMKNKVNKWLNIRKHISQNV